MSRRRPLEYYLSLQYPFTVITDSEGPGFVIKFPDLPGCMTQVDRIEDVGPMAEEIRTLWIETEYEEGADIPMPTYYEEYSGKFNVRLPRSLHRALAEAAGRDGISLNQYVATLLARNDAQARVEQRLDAIEATLTPGTAAGTARVAEERAVYDTGNPHRPRRKPRTQAAAPHKPSGTTTKRRSTKR